MNNVSYEAAEQPKCIFSLSLVSSNSHLQKCIMEKVLIDLFVENMRPSTVKIVCLYAIYIYEGWLPRGK